MGKIWVVSLTNKAYKQLQKLPIVVQDLAAEAITDLEQSGAVPKHWDVKKLDAAEYRIRLNYRYRMRYKVIDSELVIEIFYIGHRKDAYE